MRHCVPYLRVVVGGLFDHVELAVLPRVVPDAGRVVPVAIVTAHVMVQLGTDRCHSYLYSGGIAVNKLSRFTTNGEEEKTGKSMHHSSLERPEDTTCYMLQAKKKIKRIMGYSLIFFM